MLKKRIITAAVFLLIAGYAFQAAHADIPVSERDALTNLYDSTNGTGWTDSTNWTGSPGTECQWYGVTCDSQGGHVIKVELAGNSLEGNLPESLGNLTELSLINLSYNSLSGSIPVSAGNLAKLAALDLGVNSLTGNIPPGLGNILSLRYIFLHYNSLTGAVPPELGNLTYLRLLKLGNNELSGSIPPELGNLSSLQYLTLYKNRLEGGIPPEIGNLGNLRELGLQSNMLSGVIPADLAKLANMTPGKSDFRWNALYTEDDSTGIFLGTVQDGGDWESTQTVAPVSLAAGTPGPISVPLSWAGAGLADEYEVVYADVSGGPYTVFGTVTGTETEVTGLAPGTAWYFRIRSVTLPHADNPNTVFSGYSGEVSAVTPGFTLPEVTTADISSVTVSSASGGGNVTADTGVKITARGLCWNTSSVPDTADPADYACTSDGSGTGSFTSAITGLEPGTAYHAKAYAVCSAGTVFGNEAVFTTLPDVPVLTVDGPDERTVYNDLIVVTGTVSNTQYTVTAVSDRYPGLEFAALAEDTGEFSCEVPLLTGENLLTFTAQDPAGGQAEKNIRVMFLLPPVPKVTITAPADGSTVHAGTVTVSGTVLSSLEPGQISLMLGDRTAVLAGENGEYTFSFENVMLSEGANILKVIAETSSGSSSGQVTVIYDPDPGEPPEIEILSPLPNSFFTENTVVVKGTAKSGSVIESVTVNGAEALKLPESGSEVSFEHTVFFTPGTDKLQITVTATDSADRTASVTLVAEHDNTVPVITFSSPDPAPAGEIIPVEETPYPVAGTVTEKNLAGVSINSKSFYVLPAGADDTWSFEGSAALVRGQEFSAVIEAWDHAGNRTYHELILRLDSALEIEVITPKDRTELVAGEATLDVNITVRVPGIAENDIVRVSIDEAEAATLSVSGITANGTSNITASDGEHRLVTDVVNADGEVLARTTTYFTVINTMNIPLSLERQEPENGTRNVETNTFIAFYFNKPADPQQLEVEVLETAHGQIYDIPEPGADFTQLSNISLVEVHRDREPVPGGVSMIPGNAAAAFYPKRKFAYGGIVYVTIRYSGMEISRSVFNTRPLPTFIQGFVAGGMLMNPIPGIEVVLPELARKSVTDSNGMFGFGFGEPAEHAVTPGIHRAVVNPGLKNRAFGSVELWINVEKERLNTVGVTPVPILNYDSPFRRIASGQQNPAVLADGELILDLGSTVLSFPDGRDRGDVHIQFTELFEMGYRSLGSATPHWAFTVQPIGIKVSGSVGMVFSMPALNGSYDYISGIGERVVLIGLDHDSLQIVPAGVGTVSIENRQVASEGKTALERLDYLGYAIADYGDQPVLERYAKGEISLVRMIGELELQR